MSNQHLKLIRATNGSTHHDSRRPWIEQDNRQNNENRSNHSGQRHKKPEAQVDVLLPESERVAGWKCVDVSLSGHGVAYAPHRTDDAHEVLVFSHACKRRADQFGVFRKSSELESRSNMSKKIYFFPRTCQQHCGK